MLGPRHQSGCEMAVISMPGLRLYTSASAPYRTFPPSSARYAEQNPPNFIHIGIVVFDPEEARLLNVSPKLDFGNDHFLIIKHAKYAKCNATKVQPRVWIVRVRKDAVFLVVVVSTSLRNDVEGLNKGSLFTHVVEKALDQPMWIVTPIGNRERDFVHAYSLVRTYLMLLAEVGHSAQHRRLPSQKSSVAATGRYRPKADLRLGDVSRTSVEDTQPGTVFAHPHTIHYQPFFVATERVELLLSTCSMHGLL